MDQYSIKNVKNPVERFDAVNKAYVDRVKYKSFTGIIPDTVLTDHTLVSFPDAKGFLSKETIIGEMWVERLPGEMISTSSESSELYSTIDECHPLLPSWSGYQLRRTLGRRLLF